jgi:flagellar biosynthesis protein FlhA
VFVKVWRVRSPVKYTNDAGRNSNVSVMTLHPNIEESIANSLLQTEQGVQLVMDPQTAHHLINQIAIAVEKNPEIAGQPILLTSPMSRRHLFKLTHRFIPQLIILSHNELSNDAHIQSVATVEITNAG